ncbi:hypothetical protein Pmar_PMAR015052 [Perkinsus marinus ATCC 50983]|uniref:Uncharacterized protein n=1 Tax=Perkinsus marinus (strain ATCC 50983 / TXsc) TaxID=423536 RepID=C5KRM4_PERM5|nr:hypothetical protein Pmar_PMAR015052 [Perkinsus marinus ATCC 50983]EER12886.1 hypothetical protein Pmar_PMAR015052 [Perkinsus marinus ATCC 50983]|eukprot:XP_002781091.1 hypothetical protein Pmar_PMAR015052 [Perkinsus marinus ATCC 50983]
MIVVEIFSDPDWSGALSLHNDAVSHTWLLIEIIYRYASPKLCGELLLQVRDALIDWETRLAPGIGAIEKDEVFEFAPKAPFVWSEAQDLLSKISPVSRRWDSDRDLCSMHVPLSRFYVMLYTLTLQKYLLSTFAIRPTFAWTEHVPPSSSYSVEEGERYVKKLCCVVKILCALVSPYVSGTTETGGKQYTEVTARHHLRQRLAVAGQLTMSYARDPRLDKFTNTLAVADAQLLQDNLEAVAKAEIELTQNTTGQRSSYSLRDDQWGLVDLLHPVWFWREQQDVEERLMGYLKREHRSLTAWWFEDVIHNSQRAKVHKDLRDQSIRLARAPEFLAICFIGLLAVK